MFAHHRSSIIIFIVHSVYLIVKCTATIPPTFTTSNLSIFNVSDYNGSFVKESLDCGSVQNCHIICHEASSCRGMEIDASSSTNLVIDCKYYKSCYRFKILSLGPTDSLQMICNGTTSCGKSNINLNGTIHIDIHCESNASFANWFDDEAAACYDADWMIHDALYTNIECGFTGCIYADITMSTSNITDDQYQPDDLLFLCSDYRSCLGLTLEASGYYSRFVFVSLF